MTTPNKDDLIGLTERRIAATGRKLAAQLGCVFAIDPRKLADFRRRASHAGASES